MNTKKNLFILTGAGVSKESGIKTFREKDGLWENYKIEDVCTVEAFIKDPNLVNNFYNERRSSIIDQKILPNEAHYQLAKLEKSGRVILFLLHKILIICLNKPALKKFFICVVLWINVFV